MIALVKTHRFFGAISILCAAASSLAIAENDDALKLRNTLNFQEAYQYTLESAFSIQGQEAEIGMRQAEKRQQGFYPNPQLNISMDSPSTTSSWNNCNNDISIGLTQLFELGGKRRARVRVADAAECETSWGLEILKCDLFANLLHAFINTASAIERLNLAKSLQEIAKEALECITIKADLGKTSNLDKKKSEIALRTANIDYTRQITEVQKAKRQLAAFWNQIEPDFETIDFDLFELEPPPPFCQLFNELEKNPEMQQSQAEISKAWKIIQLERARRIPNLEIYLGVCTERNYHDPSLSLGINIMLPIFDRNQGNISRASHEFNQITFKQMDLMNQLRSQLTILYSEWTTAYNQAQELKEIVQTIGKETYELAEEQYSSGRSDFLSLLDARTTLFNIKEQYLSASEECHHKRAEVLQLVAKCCSDIFFDGMPINDTQP